MTDPTPSDERAPASTPPGLRSGLRATVLVTVSSAIVLAAAMTAMLRGNIPTLAAELAAGVALLAFGVMVYGILRIILAMVESVGERRRQARLVSERRKGDRARKPRV
jgi:hypothetical protein